MLSLRDVCKPVATPFVCVDPKMKLKTFEQFYATPGHLFRRAGQFVTATFEAEMGHIGITASQLSAILAVHMQPGMQQRELAAALSWDEATVGGMVSRLEAQGYLERRSTTRSRRGREIYMTPAGEDLYLRIEPHVAAIQRQLLKRLKADERKQLIYLISKAMGVGAAQFDAPRTGKKA